MSELVKHECGNAAAINISGNSVAAGHVADMVRLLRHRGHEGCGFAALDSARGQVNVRGWENPPFTVVRSADPDCIDTVATALTDLRHVPAVIAHVRYATNGVRGIGGVHPTVCPGPQTTGADSGHSVALCGNFHFPEIELSTIAAVDPHTTGPALLRILAARISREWARTGSLDHSVYHSLRGMDGGYAICGLSADGTLFAVRDPHGIRPLFYGTTESTVYVASEPFAIARAAGIRYADIHPLDPGCALVADVRGRFDIVEMFTGQPRAHCPFEQIYFSSAGNPVTACARVALGTVLGLRCSDLAAKDAADHADTVVTYVPNSARKSAEAFARVLGKPLTPLLAKTHGHRNFITAAATRTGACRGAYRLLGNDVAEGAHIIVVDDSIVRGTTLRQAVIPLLATLRPARITVVSSAPRICYPDCYGIDLPDFSELVAFRAARAVVTDAGAQMPATPQALYRAVSPADLDSRIARMLTPDGCTVPVDILFQTVADMHACLGDGYGDWNFTGRYPTAAGAAFARRQYLIALAEQ